MLLVWNVFSLLSTHLAVIQQCAGNMDIVDCHICLHRQLGACPRSSLETNESSNCLHNPLVVIGVQGDVVSDDGADAGELTDSIEFIGFDRPFAGRLVFYRLMVRPKSCEKQSVNDWSSSWVWCTTAASSANSLSPMRTSRTFDLALRRASLKRLPSERVRR